MTKKLKLFTGSRYKEVIEHIKKLNIYFNDDFIHSPYISVVVEDKGYTFGMFLEVHRFYEDTEHKEISVDEFLELKPLEYVEGYRRIGTGDVEDGFKMSLTDPVFDVFTKHDYALAYGNLPRLIYLRDKYDSVYKDYGWKTDNESYHVIYRKGDSIEKERVSGFKTLLSFVNKSARDKFFEEQVELVIKCKAFL